jgi:hypothetical protein
MNNSSLLKYFFILFLLFNTGISFGGVKFFQSCKINTNGSVNITITYSANQSEISGNKVGNLPFEINEVKQFFFSSESEIKKSLVYKDPADNSISAVTVDIFIRNFNKFSDTKGLNNFKSKWLLKGDAMEFSLLVPASFFKENLIDTYQFHLISDDKIISSNGVIENNLCKWYVTKEKLDPGGAYFLTEVSSTEKNIASSSGTGSENKPEENISEGNDKNPESQEKVENKDENKEENGKCGVFSIELPALLLFGICVSNYNRKRKNK